MSTIACRRDTNNGAPERPFEVFFVLRYDPRPLAPPRVLLSLLLPPQQLLLRFPMLGQFCFPEKSKTVSIGEVDFTFVLTNALGVQLFGHCIRTVNAEVYGFISRYAWCRLFQQLISSFRYNGEDTSIIEALSRTAVPPPGHPFVMDSAKLPVTDITPRKGSTSSLINTTKTMMICRPPDAYNPYVDASPALLLRWMSTDTLLIAIASILCERRIAVVAPDVGTASHVILALLSLLRPFTWSHVLVPVIPFPLLGVLAAPTPYIVGVLQSQLGDALKQGGVNNVVVVCLEGCEILPSDRTVSTTGGGLLLKECFPALIKRRQQARRSSVECIKDSDAMGELQAPLTLPWTSSLLCPLRVAIGGARRIVSRLGKDVSWRSAADSPALVEANRILLNAFMDYYVHAFGPVLTPEFDPREFIHSCTQKGDSANASAFFTSVIETILFMQFRDQYMPALRALEDAAAKRDSSICDDDWLPETAGGFVEAALLFCRRMYPRAGPLAERALQKREEDITRISSTLVTPRAPLFSLRTLGRFLSYQSQA